MLDWARRPRLPRREALTTGDAGGARRISKRAAIEGATGTPSLQRFTPTTGAPMPDPSMTCGSVTYSERCDFRCGSFASVWRRIDDFRSTLRTNIVTARRHVSKVPITATKQIWSHYLCEDRGDASIMLIREAPRGGGLRSTSPNPSANDRGAFVEAWICAVSD